MYSFAELAAELNRPAVYLRGLQDRFELPAFEGAGYSVAYLAFLRTLVHLRALSIPEETLRDLWHIEKKLLHLLHLDSTGSPTWFLDSCGVAARHERRLLLTNHDLGMPVPSKSLQLGLNYSASPPELFEGKDMGEDAIRVLNSYLKLHSQIRADVEAELPHLRAAVRWAGKM